MGRRIKLKTQSVQKILIIQTGKMGDMVCTTPMFRSFKKAYPHARLTVVGNAINRELLEGNSDVDEYIVWNPASILEKLKAERFDFACITGPNFYGLAMLILSGVPCVCVPKVTQGESPYETKSYRFLNHFVLTKEHPMDSYAPQAYLRLLEPLGIYSSDTKKHLSFSTAAAEKVEEMLNTNSILETNFIVGISPGAGNKIKQWPPRRFSKVIDHLLRDENVSVVIVGGKNDTAEGEETITELQNKRSVVNTIGKLSVDELKALISKFNLFISVDTGPIYIAEAFEVPTVDIVGPMSEHGQPPVGHFHRVVVPPGPRQPQLYVMNARSYNTAEALRQVESITAEAVIQEIDRLLPLIHEYRNRI